MSTSTTKRPISTDRPSTDVPGPEWRPDETAFDRNPWMKGALVALAALVVVVVGFFALGGDADLDVNSGDIDIESPAVDLDVEAPDVDVDLPSVDVDGGNIDIDRADVEADASTDG